MTHASDGSVFEIAPYTFADGVFTANFRGELHGEPLEFAERFDFTAIGSTERPSEGLLKLLALASSLSYYKATYAATIRVAFALTAAEITYLRELVKNGLGEYAFVNDMAFKLAPEITAEQAAAEPSREWNFDSPPLVAVGGGKDSIVSIEALKATGHKPVLFSVGDRGSIASSVRVSGLEHIIVRRHIDRRLMEANANGAPNGHVPVTAINSAIGLIAAELAGLGPLILSNEESAEYGNLEWNGQNVNHQWSKSLAAEDLLRDTLEDSGLSKDRYFSLLRSFREIEIARAFSHHEQYFHDFTSCNRAYVLNEADRSNGWCGECPKCAFVAIILAPYIDRPQLTSIFGKDMLDDEALVPTFLDILGVGDQKPFECVGEPSEGVEALTLVVDGGQWADSDVVARLSTAAGRAANNHTSRGPDRVPALFADARDLVGQA